jgi:23S rRNA (cytosine1962-C5)-methyltransferase
LKANNKSFDFIICDPPSSSSDGEKRTSAVKAYKDLLEKMNKLLKPSGKLVIFLNTHQVGQEKFDRILKDYLSELKLNYKMITRLQLAQDCPTLKGFPEGSYLKGIVLEKQ